MMIPISKDSRLFGFFLKEKKLILSLSGGLFFIMLLTIFQDFMESRRSGYDFNFSESLLFNLFWILCIPILMVLQSMLKKEKLNTNFANIKYIGLAIGFHLQLFPLIASIISTIFYHGQYSFLKFLSYTLTHDLYKLFIIYPGFVLAYKLFYFQKNHNDVAELVNTQKSILIHTGKEKLLVKMEEIIQITSATPYVCIHLENKKYLHTETLKSLCSKLDNSDFIRIHKTTIINIKKLSSIKSRLNGDYDIVMVNGEILRLSRTYAADFKKRINQAQQVEL